jgi:hypothetical protein
MSGIYELVIAGRRVDRTPVFVKADAVNSPELATFA